MGSTANDINEIYAQSTGTTAYYRHGLLRNLLYTQGVNAVAEEAGAYWVLDVIASYQIKPPIRDLRFQVWTLEVSNDNTAVITMKEDSGEPILVEQTICHTDFPAGTWSFWLIDGVIILPSEY